VKNKGYTCSSAISLRMIQTVSKKTTPTILQKKGKEQATLSYNQL